MIIIEGEYEVKYNPETGDAIVSRNKQQFMHICMDCFLKKSDILRAFKELMIGINGVQ